MKYRPLANTDVKVSELGLGANQFGATCDQTATTAIVHRALELGVNFIDTADNYGDGASEEALGSALVGKRNNVVLATKTGAGKIGRARRLSRQTLVTSLEQSLRRLRTDRV